MDRLLLRIFGIGAWANGAWDFNAYFIHGGIIPYLHSWQVFLPMFGIFFAYPIVGLFLIFAKMSLRTDIAKGLNDIETSLASVLDIELEAYS